MKEKPMQTILWSVLQKKGTPKTGLLFNLLWVLLVAALLHMPAVMAAEGSADEKAASIQIKNPASDLWRQVRQRDNVATDGNTQMRSVDAAILINPEGEKWRQFRMLDLIPIGGFALLGIIVLIVLFYLVRGNIKVSTGLSAKKLLRYTLSERVIHWFMAITFIILALSGLIILFGRSTLIPIMGNEAFSPLASFSKVSHDVIGPLFALAMILMFFKYVSRNFFAKGDLMWLLKGGGMIGKGHPRAGFFNMGEKSVFWLVMIVGIAISASGFILLFANFGQGRVLMELSHLVHGIAVVGLTAVIIGHIYIGTIGMQGSYEGMSTGYCDLNWAKEHHSDWAATAESEAISNEEVEKIRGS